MKRYFFDFDEVPDKDGVDMPSVDEAFYLAVTSMPEYVAGLLLRDKLQPEMTCVI